jgi:hypothetical protein
MSSGKEWRISIIRHITPSTLNLDLTGLSRWLTHEVQEKRCRMDDSGWINIPLDKSMKNDENQAM